jgi:hypothetical protein
MTNVPEGMLKAAIHTDNFRVFDPRGIFLRPALEAALRWLSEKLDELEKSDDSDGGVNAYKHALDDVRRMFLSPDPQGCPHCGCERPHHKIPAIRHAGDSEIEDLLCGDDMRRDLSISWSNDDHDRCVREAYQRGLKGRQR